MPTLSRLVSRPVSLSFRSMASTSKSKLIFAPGEAPSDSHAPQQAAQFQIGTLHRSDLDSDPFVQFHQWFSDPHLKGTVPETCTLSTAHLPSGRVSARMVYLKELDDQGFVVYSNWGTSGKASDLSTNPHASLTFWHKPTERQIRIEGTTERLTPQESQTYFDTRARGSRIGAWASQQSSVLRPQSRGTATDSNSNQTVENPAPIESNTEKHQHQHEPAAAAADDGRAELDTQVRDVEERFAQQAEIPVPPFWGGLRLVPDMVEFWQGRESRLHDRFRYTLVEGESIHGESESTPETGSESKGLMSAAQKKGTGTGGREKTWRIERLSP